MKWPISGRGNPARNAAIDQDQREERLTAIRSADPAAYLAEFERGDEMRWHAELEVLRPKRFEAEMEHREQDQQAERERECNYRKLTQIRKEQAVDIAKSEH